MNHICFFCIPPGFGKRPELVFNKKSCRMLSPVLEKIKFQHFLEEIRGSATEIS